MDQQALEKERDLLDAALLEEKRELGKRDFWFFITHIVFPETWEKHYTPELHGEMCQQLMNLKTGEDFWAFLPRKRRKSYIISVLHSLWLIIRDPNVRILLVGARENTVKPFSILIRNAFIKGTPGFEEFQRVYWDYMLESSFKNIKQSMQFTLPNRTIPRPDPTFRATYVGVTGAGWRADVVKFDDPVERRNVTSPEMSMKVLTQMMDFYPLLDDTAEYQNITGAGTRWAYHDPYGRVLGDTTDMEEGVDISEELEGRKTKIMVRHALEDPDKLCEHCPPHVMKLYPHNHPTMEPNGISCSAPIHTYEHVMADYKRYMINPTMGESLFWHQLMNICLAPSDQKFQPEWFFDLEKPGWAAPKRRVLCIDSADKDFQREGIGDFMVALFGEFDDEGRLLIRHGLRSNKWTRDEFQRQIMTWCQAVNWWPHIVVKEKFSNDTFLTDLGTRFRNMARPTRLKAYSRPSKLKKLDWIVEQLQSPMEQGLVVWGSKVPKQVRERGEFELTNMGQSAYDDVADTLGLFFIPEVRIERKLENPAGHQKWNSPSLELYHGPTTPPKIPDPPQMPTQSELLQDGGRSNINIDNKPSGLSIQPNPQAKGLTIHVDQHGGTGGWPLD